jgi:Arc/MetJ family transcription regulator
MLYCEWVVECVYRGCSIHIEAAMRTNIDIDDELLSKAMEALGTPTKKATVEEALRQLVQTHNRRRGIIESAGLGWEGDLQAMRRGRPDRDKI